MAIDSKKREQAEKLIYEIMDTLDPSNANSDLYKEQFSKMSDTAFENHFKTHKELSLRFHIDAFNIEPTMKEVKKALKKLNVPMNEKVNMPDIYTNSEGVPVQSKEALVGYIHIKKVQQFVTKKNAMSTSIEKRDMTTGLLLDYDKNGKTSDKEAEALVVMGLDATTKEFIGFKADSMNAKNLAYNIINSKGELSLSELPYDQEDSLAKQLLDVYLLGSMIKTNIMTDSYLTPYYSKDRKSAVQRI